MKPCDCKDMVDVKKLNEQGIGFNEVSLLVRPVSVILQVGPCRLRIYNKHFKRLAEWFLENQKENHE